MTVLDLSLSTLRKTVAPTPAQLAARVERFRVNFLNRFIRQNNVGELIQFGCGDGKLPQRLKVAAYTGVDTAAVILAQCCRGAGPGRQFLADEELPAAATTDLALSVDAIPRLVADTEFNAHIRRLFDTARRHVIVQGGDAWPAWAAATPTRRLTAHVARFFPGWRLAAHIPAPFPPSAAAGDFFIYSRGDLGCVIPVLALI